MRTLHFGLRVADLDRSLAFYAAVGYEIVGNVPETGLGHLTMLRLPGGEFVTIELVHNPGETAVDGGTRLSHFAIHVDSMDVTLTELRRVQGVCATSSASFSDGVMNPWVLRGRSLRLEFRR